MNKLRLTLVSGTCLPLILLALIAAGTPKPVRADAPRVVPITAKRFGFTPNTITLKQGEPVTLHLTSEDVVHGFYLKPLRIDEVVGPDKPVDVTVTPTTAGKYTIICDHFCGSGHGNMNMTVVVE
jgi:cytochrome c oxidase subunit II